MIGTHGIILAAGRGSRMGKLTQDKPKCFAEIDGKRLIDWQISALLKAGVGPVAVVTGYRSESFLKMPVHRFLNSQWEKTNMVMSLLAASQWLHEFDCIVSYSDIVYHPLIITTLVKARGEIVVTYDKLWADLWKLRFTDPLVDAESFKRSPDGHLLEIGNRAKALDEVEGQYMGLLKFTPALWGKVEETILTLHEEQRNKLDMTSLLQQLLAKKIRIETIPVNGRWCEVDSEKDLLLYERLIQTKLNWSHDWRFDATGELL